MSNLDPDAMGGLPFETEGGNGNENLVLNLDGVSEEAPQLEALPVGTYECIVDNVEFGNSSSGNPMITWKFKVVDPQYSNRTLYFHNVLNQDFGLSALKRTLVRVCPDVDLKTFNPAVFCDEGTALGLPCRVKVKIKKYKGQYRNNVDDVLAPDVDGMSYLDQR